MSEFSLISESAPPLMGLSPAPCSPSFQVWKCGGGTQSVAIGALIIQGRLPKPDAAVIVDTGREKRTTWEYLDAVLNPALAAVGVTVVRVKKEDYAKEDVWDLQNKHLLIPVFTNQTVGSVGKLSNFCSDKWKTRVADRWLRAQGVTSWRAWIGFSVDEPRRWVKHIKNPLVWVPLAMGVQMKRQESLDFVMGEMGWPEPPRSNCWMCPNQSDDEWLEMKNHRPEEFQMAVEFERELRTRDPFAFLHEQCVPLDQVDWTKEPTLPFERACGTGECFV